jgi:nucleoside 2-deoxyribosyltransferase
MESHELKAVISGSFKFKPEIDAAHEAFRDHNVLVLAPDKGWLYMAPHQLSIIKESDMLRPLPSEQHMTAFEIEQSFLDSMRRSDFLYILNQEGYVGNSTAFELGFAIGIGKPIYASEAIILDEPDLTIRALINEYVTVLPIEQIAGHFRNRYAQ